MRNSFEIIETKMNLLADNDRIAKEIREYLKQKKVFLVNLMACPGAGKTSLLCHTINRFKNRYRIGVIEADADGDVDARTVSALGVKTIQVHTNNSCHMDAPMTRFALEKMGVDDLDLIFLENVGNLVCPAEFDVGSNVRVMMLSVSEGDDKPLKYPLMFQVSDVMIVNKIDALEVFDFDMKRLELNVRPLNEKMEIIPVSCSTEEGLEKWYQWLENRLEEKHEGN